MHHLFTDGKCIILVFKSSLMGAKQQETIIFVILNSNAFMEEASLIQQNLPFWQGA